MDDISRIRPYTFNPIGVIRSMARYRWETARQGAFSERTARLELLDDKRLEAAASDLAGFDRIWVLFVFHLNEPGCWRPKVSPPVTRNGERYSLFSTRSPHRPNPLGMSCVQLEKVEGRFLHLHGVDMLDGTPVLDIKPYIPDADAFPVSRAGWRDGIPAVGPWNVVAFPSFSCRAEWLAEKSSLDLDAVCRVQLSHDPLDGSRKRVRCPESGPVFQVRTWRIPFVVDSLRKTVSLLSVESNYTDPELLPDSPDTYQDKDLHRAFRLRFGVSSDDRDSAWSPNLPNPPNPDEVFL